MTVNVSIPVDISCRGNCPGSPEKDAMTIPLFALKKVMVFPPLSRRAARMMLGFFMTGLFTRDVSDGDADFSGRIDPLSVPEDVSEGGDVAPVDYRVAQHADVVRDFSPPGDDGASSDEAPSPDNSGHDGVVDDARVLFDDAAVPDPAPARLAEAVPRADEAAVLPRDDGDVVHADERRVGEHEQPARVPVDAE